MADAVAATYSPANLEPPWVTREFRGVWIATVGNVDWPSTNNLTTAQQKAEMIAILDRAAALNLNAVIFQARPAADALYDSKIEPWSYYLTGAMGRAPSPWYDPLRFAIDEAHKRGLELHAWFSPYRAVSQVGKFPISADHISRTRPDLARRYGTQVWLDPGEPAVQDYTVRVIMDVVNRYDLDGVHFDDRLGYPTEKDAHNRTIEFPDDASWRRYEKSGGRLGRDDWRRENVNAFVQRIYSSVKAAKPWVKVGIAPAGIWEKGYPPQIKGQSAYEALYTDSRKWLMNGWLDYFSPQLYWSIAAPDQSFPALLNWWREQNARQRNLWPGLDAEKTGGSWPAQEISAQIRIVRDDEDGASGTILYSAKALLDNRGGIATELSNGVYAKPALVPASPWLETGAPEKPSLRVEDGRRAVWEPAGTATNVSVWVWQTLSNGQWQTRILPGGTRSVTLTGSPEAVAVTEVDRVGLASPAAVLRRDANPAR